MNKKSDLQDVNSTDSSIGLNPPQLEAVQHFLGSILVLAGAGSGKTRVLTYRIANLIKQHGVSADSILAVTFTNKATEEMRERLRHQLGHDADKLWVATFHSTALRILRRHANSIGYENDFAIYDDQDTKAVLKLILKELSIDEKKYPTFLFSKAIDQAKNSYIFCKDFISSDIALAIDENEREMYLQVYNNYQKTLKQANAMDFGDLIMNVVWLFNDHQDILSYYQSKIQFILVDEYQDTNYVQYLLINQLAAKHKNLLVVGDDDQSIYAFRGATIRNILEFEKDYPETKIIKLEQNYRSTTTILNAAYGIISKNKSRKDKKLWSNRGPGELISTFVADNEQHEASFISYEIMQLLSKDHKGKDIAIFYRTNAQSRALEESLMNHGISYRIYGGLRFYDRKEVKDIVAYLRVLLNEYDLQAFVRIVNNPPRGIGAQTLNNIVELSRKDNISCLVACEKLASSNKNLAKFMQLIKTLRSESQRSLPSVLIEKILDISGYKAALLASKDPNAASRLENLQELVVVAKQQEVGHETCIEALRALIDRIALSSSAEIPQNQEGHQAAPSEEDTVSLMTLHVAKGLEFPLAFITGFEEGLLPHYRSTLEGDIDEERRLCYVGVTRAMDKLYITRARERGFFGASGSYSLSGMHRKLSRFAKDIPFDCFEDADSFLSGTYYDLEAYNDIEHEQL